MGRNSGLMLGSLGRLFSRGTVTGLSEDELLERFAIDRDEAAFAALVARHGPMVLGVCRRILRDERDVEDAFQATFLILVRRAGSIRDGRLIGRWLHGVAHRVAVRSRAQAARRFVHERPATGDFKAAGASPAQTAGEREVSAVLDEELARLPGALRSPMVLCYLEGLTHDEAANRLGWPVGTVRSRMARARDILHRRLSRRGIMASGAALPGSMAKTSVSLALIDSTVRTSVSFATKSTLAATVASLTAAGLANEVLHAMLITRLTVLGATGLTCILTLGGPTLARRFTGAGRDAVQFVQGVGPVTIAQAEPPSTPAETKSESESPTNGKTTQVNPKRENPVVESKLEGLKENLKALKNRQVLIEQHLEQMSKEAEEAQNKFEQLMNQYADSRREWIRLRIERDSIEAQIARLSDGQAVVRDNEPRSTEVAKRSPIAIQIPTAETVKQKADPGQGLPAMKRLGDVLFVVSPTGDKVSAASLDGTKLKSVRLSEPGDPPQEVSLAFIGSEDLPKGSNPSPYVTLRQRGGKVHRLAIFLLKEWVWRTFELPEPVTNAGAIVTPDLVFFQLDNGAVAAYSLLANRWDLLKFATPHDEGLTYSTEGNISIVTRPGHIYRYDSRIGRWSDLDTKALLNQPDRDAAASLDEQSTQSGPR